MTSEPVEGDPVTPGMMIAALNQILGECGYQPVRGDLPERLIEDARTRADGIVAAARQTAELYTDAALVQAARTVISARQTAVTIPPRREPARPVTTTSDHVGGDWYAAVVAAGVFLPLPAEAARRRLHDLAERLRYAAAGDPVDLEEAYRAGAQAVELGLGHPAVLPGTIKILTALVGAGDALGSFVAGHAAAMQERILGQQESLHRATLRAAREFERALEDSEARYRRLAYYDPLTGLANRARLVQRLEQAARLTDRGRHVGVCLIDLGGFPAIREQYGPDAGDHILIDVARRLRAVTRNPDHLLVRHGGRSFTLLLQDTGGAAHLVEVAERILGLLAAPVTLPEDGPVVPLAAAVGVVDRPAPGLDVSQLLVDAEIAVRQARSGRTGWAVHDRRDSEPVVPGTITGLVTAPPTYQPILDPAGQRVLGLHVRAHWRHPQLGRLNLGRIGELTGDRAATTRLAGQVLHQVCRQAVRWSGAPGGPYIGVDLPIRRIGYPDVVDLVREALTATGLPAERLQVQLSGLDAVPAGAHSHTVLAALGALGVRVVLDDFGAGYTSVAYLRDLPIHGLRSPLPQLTAGVTGEAADRTVVTGLATIAHALGLTLTVHGVDDERLADGLAASGCDAVQGLRYSGPATPHRVSALLQRPATVAGHG
ncbi:EAL domain-containing protein [Actinoplanes sp. NPDC049265]|uniref:EAL domain-containing protein n=1 Tax=Actinoplanes sp. NPDC049265 TaxID=3363902 RepID=UPI003719EEC0